MEASKDIVQEGEHVLRKTAEPLPHELFGTEELQALLSRMTDALDKQPEGVALAAPQMGVSYRLFIVRRDRTTTATDHGATGPQIDVYINPRILKTSRRRALADEGCLSVRGVYGTTNRHARVTLRAQREDGSTFERGAGGLMAQIFEHEIDHLNGILFIDHAEHLAEVQTTNND